MGKQLFIQQCYNIKHCSLFYDPQTLCMCVCGCGYIHVCVLNITNTSNQVNICSTLLKSGKKKNILRFKKKILTIPNQLKWKPKLNAISRLSTILWCNKMLSIFKSRRCTPRHLIINIFEMKTKRGTHVHPGFIPWYAWSLFLKMRLVCGWTHIASRLFDTFTSTAPAQYHHNELITESPDRWWYPRGASFPRASNSKILQTFSLFLPWNATQFLKVWAMAPPSSLFHCDRHKATNWLTVGLT